MTVPLYLHPVKGDFFECNLYQNDLLHCNYLHKYSTGQQRAVYEVSQHTIDRGTIQ